VALVQILLPPDFERAALDACRLLMIPKGGDLEVRIVAHWHIRDIVIIILAVLVVVDDSVEVAYHASRLEKVCFPLLPGDQLVTWGLYQGSTARRGVLVRLEGLPEAPVLNADAKQDKADHAEEEDHVVGIGHQATLCRVDVLLHHKDGERLAIL
jgi:hypothetical protein